jgi:hypothetical protein
LVYRVSILAGFEVSDVDMLVSINTAVIHLPPGWPDYRHDIAVLALPDPFRPRSLVTKRSACPPLQLSRKYGHGCQLDLTPQAPSQIRKE